MLLLSSFILFWFITLAFLTRPILLLPLSASVALRICTPYRIGGTKVDALGTEAFLKLPTRLNLGFQFSDCRLLHHLSSLWVRSRGNSYCAYRREYSLATFLCTYGCLLLCGVACTRSGSDYFPSFSVLGVNLGQMPHIHQLYILHRLEPLMPSSQYLQSLGLVGVIVIYSHFCFEPPCEIPQ